MTDQHPPTPRDLLVTAADRARIPERLFRHPIDPDAEIHFVDLGRKTGLSRVGVTLSRVSPGRASYPLHLHHGEEECMLVLAGRGAVVVGRESFDMGPGDFAAFPPQTHPHQVRNQGKEDLVYLNVGEALGNEVVDYPDAGKQLVRRKGEARTYPLAAGEVMARTAKPPPPLPAPASLRVLAAGRGEEGTFRHPLNPRSEIRGVMLSRRAGLGRVGFSLARLAPGKESFVFHLHHVEEEFAYVVSGRGAADVGAESFEVGPGDFLGFPPATHAHLMRNTGNEDLVYVSGGENREVEVADLPREGKRLARLRGTAEIYPLAGEPLFPSPSL